MNLKKLNPQMRFQVRNGIHDFRIFIKNHVEDDYSKYLEFKLDIIDGATLPRFKTVSQDDESPPKPSEDPSESVPSTDEFKEPRKRGRKSPRKAKDPLKIMKFIDQMLDDKMANQSFIEDEDEDEGDFPTSKIANQNTSPGARGASSL